MLGARCWVDGQEGSQSRDRTKSAAANDGQGSGASRTLVNDAREAACEAAPVE